MKFLITQFLYLHLLRLSYVQTYPPQTFLLGNLQSAIFP